MRFIIMVFTFLLSFNSEATKLKAYLEKDQPYGPVLVLGSGHRLSEADNPFGRPLDPIHRLEGVYTVDPTEDRQPDMTGEFWNSEALEDLFPQGTFKVIMARNLSWSCFREGTWVKKAYAALQPGGILLLEPILTSLEQSEQQPLRLEWGDGIEARSSGSSSSAASSPSVSLPEGGVLSIVRAQTEDATCECASHKENIQVADQARKEVAMLRQKLPEDSPLRDKPTWLFTKEEREVWEQQRESMTQRRPLDDRSRPRRLSDPKPFGETLDDFLATRQRLIAKHPIFQDIELQRYTIVVTKPSSVGYEEAHFNHPLQLPSS